MPESFVAVVGRYSWVETYNSSVEVDSLPDQHVGNPDSKICDLDVAIVISPDKRAAISSFPIYTALLPLLFITA